MPTASTALIAGPVFTLTAGARSSLASAWFPPDDPESIALFHALQADYLAASCIVQMWLHSTPSGPVMRSGSREWKFSQLAALAAVAGGFIPMPGVGAVIAAITRGGGGGGGAAVVSRPLKGLGDWLGWLVS